MTLTLPKQYGHSDRNIFVLNKLYNAPNGELTNIEVQNLVENEFFDEKKDRPFLNKQDEMARYFGFISYHHSSNPRFKKITDLGKVFLNSSFEDRRSIILNTLRDQNHGFGKNNHAVPRSSSNLQPPIILLRLLKVLNFINIKEFAFVLSEPFHNLEDKISSLVNFRENKIDPPIPPKNKNKFQDPKFTIFLEEFGIIDITKYGNKKFYYLSDYLINDDFYKDLDNISYLYETENEEINLTNDIIRQIHQYQVNPDLINKLNNRDVRYVTGSSGSRRPSRDAQVKEAALNNADFLCENDNTHQSFIWKRYSDKQYVEGHHLIPMNAQDDFRDINLDRTENIFALCPACHRAFTSAITSYKKELFLILFNLRQEKYSEIFGITNPEQIFHKYYS